MKRTYKWYKFKKLITPYIFVSPALLVFAIFSVGAVVYTLYLSFFKFNLLTMVDKKIFVGIERYLTVLQDSLFYTTIFNTFYFAIGNVLIGGVFALLLAIVINQIRKAKIRNTVKVIAFLPTITSMVVAAIIWKWIYDPRLGLLNYFLELMNLPTQSWLRNPNLAMPSVIAMNIWKSGGYRMILFLAGLRNIPSLYYEAAKIDGANKFEIFRYITWPLLKPTTIFVFITSFIFSFQIFTQVYVMTGGGPGDATRTIVQYIYNTSFSYYQMGKGSAMSMLMFALVMIFTLINFKITGGISGSKTQ